MSDAATQKLVDFPQTLAVFFACFNIRFLSVQLIFGKKISGIFPQNLISVIQAKNINHLVVAFNKLTIFDDKNAIVGILKEPLVPNLCPFFLGHIFNKS